MNSVDQMIRYLSGDLDGEDSRLLEEAIKTDPEVRELFERVSDAYHLVGDQLRKRDEEAFSAQLRMVMDQAGHVPESRFRNHRKTRWIIWPVAAAIALFVAIMLTNDMNRPAYQAFYKPGRDPFILAMENGTRGMQDSLAVLFTSHQYDVLFKETEQILVKDPGNEVAGLFNLLAAIELDREMEALAVEWEPDPAAGDPLNQAIVWYRTLACLKSDRIGEAEILAGNLAARAGPYRRDAQKLLRKLKK